MPFPSPQRRKLAGFSLLIAAALLAFSEGGMVEEHDLPSSLSVGERALCTWMIDIRDLSGFARLQIQLPAGLNAEPVETQNASFTMDKGRAKLIWIDLPETDVLTIQIAVTANASFQGGEVKQWFSFIREGSRVDVEFEPHIISLDSSQKVAGVSTSELDLSPSRTWKPEASDVGIMTVRIENIDPGQFLKIEEFIPKPLATEALVNGDADIVDSFDGTRLYVWQAAPSSGFIEIQYRIMGVNSSTRPSVRGELHTTLGNQLMTIDLPEVLIELADSSEPSPKQAEGSMEDRSDKDSKESKESKDQTPPPVVQHVVSSNNEVHFKVQVLAGPHRIDVRSIQKEYSFSGTITPESNQGWMKYTTGQFDIYSLARDERVRLRREFTFPGPFVTAYKQDQRISVQEALLLTKQNWIP